MCELTCSVERDVSNGNSWSSVDDWDHNAWNPILDIGRIQNWTDAAETSARRRSRACGNHMSLCPGRGDICHRRIEVCASRESVNSLGQESNS